MISEIPQLLSRFYFHLKSQLLLYDSYLVSLPLHEFVWIDPKLCIKIEFRTTATDSMLPLLIGTTVHLNRIFYFGKAFACYE